MTSTPSATLSELSEDLRPANTTGGPADLRVLLAELLEEKPSATDPTQTTAISPTGPSSDAKIRPAVSKREQPSLGKRTVRGLTRFLMIFCMGVAATLAWQSYGDATREMIATSYPQLGWLAPQTAAAESTPEITAPTAPATGLDSPELRSILVNLGAVRQSVDELAAQFAASQQQMANDIAKLNAAEQDIFNKISSAPPPRPAAAPVRKPVPAAPQSPQEPPAR